MKNMPGYDSVDLKEYSKYTAKKKNLFDYE